MAYPQAFSDESCSHTPGSLQPEVARIDALSQSHQFVRYDARGCGLSDRHIPPLVFEQQIADLHAVIECRTEGPCALLGISMGAAIAIAYAARSYFSARNTTPQALAEAELLLKNAELGWGASRSVFRHVFMAQLLGRPDVAQQSAMEERIRLSMTSPMALAYMRHNYAIDVKAQCGEVRCPSLVFHSRGDEMVSFEQGRTLAALIPGARFVPLECNAHHVLSTEPAARVFLEETAAFLGDGNGPSAAVRLTPRQTEVLKAIAKGQTDKQIARALQLSPRTVEMHVAAVLKSLACASRAEAVAKASQAGALR